MKKFLVMTMVVALIVGLSVGIGFTQVSIRQHVWNNGGNTHLYQLTTIDTGFIDERIDNVGIITIDKWVFSPAPGQLIEVKEVMAGGSFTGIVKHAEFSPLTAPPGPTIAEFLWDVKTAVPGSPLDFFDDDYVLMTVHVGAGVQTSLTAFDRVLYFEEMVTINMYQNKVIPPMDDLYESPDC